MSDIMQQAYIVTDRTFLHDYNIRADLKINLTVPTYSTYIIAQIFLIDTRAYPTYLLV